jgi:hypothetical protein
MRAAQGPVSCTVGSPMPLTTRPARPARVLAALSFVAWLGLFAACKRGSEGLAECDAYFKAVDGCANADEKSLLKSASDLEKEAWKYLGRDAVKTQCIERTKYVNDRCDVGPKGVSECDEYAKVMETCSNETQKNNFKNNTEQWKSRPKSGLKESCASALKMAKTFCK